MSRQDKLYPSQIEDVPSAKPLDDDRLQIDLRLKLDEVAELEAELLRRSARRQPNRKELTRLACKIYEARRARERILDKERRGLFGEPAWDMLLALYCMPSRGEFLSISGLTYAACVPQTTGLRWQRILMDEGLMEIGPDTEDLRRRFVGLTARGKALMESYLTKLFYSEAPLPTVPEQTSD
jgi:DNA-binding MarR family transcriptional regulator